MVDKRDGRVKERGYVDGIKHRKKISKEDAVSPTVTLEIIMIASALQYNEERDVSTINFTGSYLQIENNEYMIILF